MHTYTRSPEKACYVRSRSAISAKKEKKDPSTSVVKRLVWDFGPGGRTFFSMLVSRERNDLSLRGRGERRFRFGKERGEKVMHSGKKTEAVPTSFGHKQN